ncbi:FG-GAP repeat protein [Candidatus Peregrinibacteria bacterium]|nr:FG-GAP repeat protein [Candidatus Peregrinibacteria bacterium]
MKKSVSSKKNAYSNNVQKKQIKIWHVIFVIIIIVGATFAIKMGALLNFRTAVLPSLNSFDRVPSNISTHNLTDEGKKFLQKWQKEQKKMISLSNKKLSKVARTCKNNTSFLDQSILPRSSSTQPLPTNIQESGLYGDCQLNTIADPQWVGTSEDQGIGQSIVLNGDYNGDGFDDVVIAIEDYYHLTGGEVYIFNGPIDEKGIVNITEANYTFHGITNDDNAGYTIDNAGDVNGDGYDDLLVSAFSADNLAKNAGAVYLLFGPFEENGDFSQADVTFLGDHEYGLAGAFIKGAGDVNKDGYSDILITASTFTRESPANSGVVYLFYGGPNLLSSYQVSQADAVFLSQYPGEWDFLGFSLDSLGDMNQDGYDDIIIGDMQSFKTILDGMASLYYGPIERGTHYIEDAKSIFIGEENDLFGASINGIGDINHDNFPDVLLYAPGALTEIPGASYIFFGPIENGVFKPGDADVKIPGNFANLYPPYDIAMGSDINHDGYTDFFLADRFGTTYDYYVGLVYIFYGPLTAGTLNLDTAQARLIGGKYDYAGRSFSHGDSDGNGKEEIIISAYAYDNQFDNVGITYFIRGN